MFKNDSPRGLYRWGIIYFVMITGFTKMFSGIPVYFLFPLIPESAL